MEVLHLQFETGARVVFSTFTLTHCLAPLPLVKSQSNFKERDPKKLNSCLNHSCFNFFSVKAYLNFSVYSAWVRLFSSFLLLDVCSDGSPNTWVWFQFIVGT